MGCNDPKITAEMQDATDHPGTLSDAGYSRLAEQGHCSPVASGVTLTVKRRFAFRVAAGVKDEAEVSLESADGGHDTFYVMQNKIVAGPSGE